MKDIVQRPWVTVNSQIAPPSQQLVTNGINGTANVPHTVVDRPSLGWASVNQPSPISGGPNFGNGESNGSTYRMSADQGRREDTGEDGSLALIDKLPKNKQRQVYGLISGLQGGIEHLQRELDSLKRALGIDD
jgi:hypothetical protein